MNKLICGDNLEELKKIEKESVDLIYIDPPFFSNKQYEVVWRDEAEIRSFEDRWEGGIEHYIGWMKPRVEAMYEVLKPTGSFYLHCNWYANAHLRIMLDEIFGESNFQNEIIWDYGARATVRKSGFPRKHDTILFYAKSKNYTFNLLYKPYKDPLMERYNKIDSKGKRYALIKRKRTDGTIYYGKCYPKEGAPETDVWNISLMASTSRERLGYPTQKPEALLEKIIKASSNRNDTVLDAFCGCGTALAAAQKLGRQWIGIDISPTAIKLIERRLNQLGTKKDTDYIVAGTPTTVKDLLKLKPFEFQNWVIDALGAKHSRKKIGDMGLDGHFDKDIFHKDAGIQVKQSEDIGRNVIDNFKSALERAKYKEGIVVAFSFGKGACEEVARLKNSGEIDIKLITVEDLLHKKVKL
ncbi:MAG: DNA methyltransferase [Candidatus Omnitrophica bacterium]|nr:DNA methyltransferase [Candidatus Omnitrophota bacterium]